MTIILAGAHIAPKYKFVSSIVIAAIYSIFIILTCVYFSSCGYSFDGGWLRWLLVAVGFVVGMLLVYRNGNHSGDDIAHRLNPNDDTIKESKSKSEIISKSIGILLVVVVVVLGIFVFSENNNQTPPVIHGAAMPHSHSVSQWQEPAQDPLNPTASKDQFYLGCKYYADRNYAKAVMWYKKAAEQGDAEAQDWLGDCYLSGEGVAQDEAQAVKWYRKAAEQGNTEAQISLGGCYLGKAEAVKWYRKAAEQGDAFAQFMLGTCYNNGYGVPKDDVVAYMWYNLSAAKGDDCAAKCREELGSKMTPEQIAEAQRLSRDALRACSSK
jgi:tetratricopeptide (TPR) repeat protein